MKLLKTVFNVSLFVFGLSVMAQDPHTDSGLRKCIVQEVLQVASYTYLNVQEEDGENKWIAVPTIEAQLGESYYYKGGMPMPNFHSTELDRTFDSVLFLGSITSAEAIDIDSGMVDPNATIEEETKPVKQPTLDQLELNIEAVEGGIRIATLFENPQQYAGKSIKVAGEVTKFSANIMGKNWIHFQDGTSYEGTYDLMLTSQEIVSVGDVVVFEGVITLNKDFGAGYTYNIIIENATVIK